MAESHSAPQPPVRRLADMLRLRAESILSTWEAQVRTLHPAERLERPVLRDHMPDFIEQLAGFVEARRHGLTPEPPGAIPRIHAIERLELGFDLNQVVGEYRILRACLLSVVGGDEGASPWSAELPALHDAIDQAISLSVVRYTAARERTLRALDRIAEASLDEPDVIRFLQKLLTVLTETVDAVDAAKILLLEGDELVVRATVGLEAEQDKVRHKLGESFAGRVALERRAIMLPVGSEDDSVPGAVKERAGRALVGIPLIYRGELVGVAVMGSSGAYEFSSEDQLLFRTMAARATAIIVQGQLLERERGARTQAEQLEARIEAMVQAMPVGVVMRDAEGRLLLHNAEYQRIWGEPPPAAQEGYDRELFLAGGQRLEAEDWPLSRALRGEPAPNQRLEFLRGDERIIIQVSAVPVLAAGGKVAAVVGTMVDLTAEARSEAELRAALHFRDHLIGVLSHDLRNPLAVIKTSAHVLLQGAANEQQIRATTRIVSNADRMERLIHDLLDYTRARVGGGIPVLPRTTNLFHLCQQVIDSMEVLHPSRSLRLTVEGNTRGEWDPDRILQVISNLLSNAIAYSPDGTPIAVTLTDQRGIVELTVHNEGAPIPDDKLKAVFEPFQRGQESGPGLGLGLYIVREIVRAHGGTVAVESGAGRGTRFIVRLPRV